MFISKISDIQFINKETLYSIILIGYSVFLFYLGAGSPSANFFRLPGVKKESKHCLIKHFRE